MQQDIRRPSSPIGALGYTAFAEKRKRRRGSGGEKAEERKRRKGSGGEKPVEKKRRRVRKDGYVATDKRGKEAEERKLRRGALLIGFG